MNAAPKANSRKVKRRTFGGQGSSLGHWKFHLQSIKLVHPKSISRGGKSNQNEMLDCNIA